jgi:hypothetical protein
MGLLPEYKDETDDLLIEEIKDDWDSYDDEFETEINDDTFYV